MQRRLPTFSSVFLDGICRRIEARGKALKHQGKLTWDTKQPDDYEWISFYFEPVVGHYIICQFCEDSSASIFVRCRSRARRGKVMLAIEDVYLFNDSVGIVDALEVTIFYSSGLHIDEPSEALEHIRAAWFGLQARIAEGE